jgi:hypothetical protein
VGRSAVGRRAVGSGTALALTIATAVLAGCTSGTTSSGSDPNTTGTTVSETASPSVTVEGSQSAAALTFCSAAKAWATAPAQEQFRKAVAASDNAGAARALQAWTAATKEMTAALPDDAPADVKQAFATFTATIEGAGQGTVKTDEQGEFQLASQAVTAYVGVECTSSSSASPSDSQPTTASPSVSPSAETPTPTEPVPTEPEPTETEPTEPVPTD